jgi:two-component system phosphate regulon sensor histidine kinase PhoR
MLERRSLKWPITLGVILFVLLVLITVGWVLLSYFGAMAYKGAAPIFWTLLTVGILFLVLVIVGVAMYLALSVKAIALSQRQSNFVDSVTHELKSPIASLKLYLQTLNRRTVGPEEQAVFLRYMLEDVERLDRLITHLLATARLDRQTVEPEVEEIDLEPILRQCIEEVWLTYQASPDSLQATIEPSTVKARRADLDMLFRNLIDNALKYAGEPPMVQVVSRPLPDGTVMTQIIDNGSGIPPRFRRKIFGRFVRLGSELEREKPGTGIGLYIVHTLVKRLRGKIRVGDGNGGSGASFEVILPGTAKKLPTGEGNTNVATVDQRAFPPREVATWNDQVPMTNDQ